MPQLPLSDLELTQVRLIIPAFENGKTITALTPATVIDETETIEISQAGNSKKVALALALSKRAQLVGGKVPMAQLPNMVDVADAVVAAQLAETNAEIAQGITVAAEAQTLIYRDAAASMVTFGPAMPPYADLAALIAANPDHARTHLTIADGNWNYWNGATFVAGGAYQTALGVSQTVGTSTVNVPSEYAVKTELNLKLDAYIGNINNHALFVNSTNLFDCTKIYAGKNSTTDDANIGKSYLSLLEDNAGRWDSGLVRVKVGKTYYLYFNTAATTPYISVWDKNGLLLRIIPGSANVTIAEGEEYISWWSINGFSASNIMCIEGSEAPAIYIPYSAFAEVGDNRMMFGSDIITSEAKTNISKISKNVGKNKFNKATITTGYEFNYLGVKSVNAGSAITDYMKVEAGSTRIQNSAFPYVYNVFYDKDLEIVSIFESLDTPQVVPAKAEYERRAFYWGIGQGREDRLQVEIGSVSTVYEDYTELNGLLNPVVTTLTCKRTGTSGIDADFCGLNAIWDAREYIVSVGDNSPSKRYRVVFEGHFLFTDPSEFEAEWLHEPSIIVGLDYVEYIGLGSDKSIVEIRLPSGCVFPHSSYFGRDLTYTDYQPIATNAFSSVFNMQAIGGGTRYVFHIEYSDIPAKQIHVKDCVLSSNFEGRGYDTIFGTGGGPQFDWLIERCKLRSKNNTATTAFAYHTKLDNVDIAASRSTIKIVDCDFDIPSGNSVSISVYEYNRRDLLIIENCRWSSPLTSIYVHANNGSKRAIGTIPEVRSGGPSRLAYIEPTTIFGLRVTTNTGANTSVRFDETCSAFAIVGNAGQSAEERLDWDAIKVNGYEYKDDTVGANAYACGWVNIDPTSGSSLGVILGDCSGTSKTLTIIINGTSHDVVFDSDLTAETNTNIITAINTVISSVATCDTFNPEFNMFPTFSSYKNGFLNVDTETIFKGMGIIKTGISSIRRAKQSDGHIDGISLDTIFRGQKGRINEDGIMYNKDDTTEIHYNNIYPTLTSLLYGNLLSIHPTNDGEFVEDASAPVLTSLSSDVVKFVK